MTATTVVLDAGDLDLPGAARDLTLHRPEGHVFDRIVHEHPPVDDEDPFDLRGMGPELLAACACAPQLTVEQAGAVLADCAAGDADAVLEQCLALCLPTPVDRAWWRLERDGRLRAEMDYCGPAGIPHSQFLGGLGLWDDHDRELALAWDLRRRATCTGCHTRRDQWLDDEGRVDPHAMDVDWEECPGCYRLSRAKKAATEGGGERGADVLEYTFPRLVPADDLDDDEGDG